MGKAPGPDILRLHVGCCADRLPQTIDFILDFDRVRGSDGGAGSRLGEMLVGSNNADSNCVEAKLAAVNARKKGDCEAKTPTPEKNRLQARLRWAKQTGNREHRRWMRLRGYLLRLSEWIPGRPLVTAFPPPERNPSL